MTPADEDALFQKIRDSQADVLFVALGQPKGERWMAQNLHRIAAPVSVQVGASLDFAAGRVRRAPQWMQDAGLEWVYRTLQEPARLAPRYARNIAFLTRMLAADLGRALRGRPVETPNEPAPSS